MIRRFGGVVAVLSALLLGACGESSDAPAQEVPTAPPTATIAPAAPTALPTATPALEETEDTVGDGLFPDVIEARLEPAGEGRFTVFATLSSPYDSPSRYADAWRVLAPDGTVLGVRELLHDHATEQPFTRSLSGVEIPEGIREVTIEGRDQVNGYGGATVTVSVPGR